jgi:hypothetical protein
MLSVINHCNRCAAACAVAVVLVLLVCLALPASSQQIWPLDVTLNGDWVDDVAIGTVTVINPTKGSIQVSWMPGTGAAAAPCMQQPVTHVVPGPRTC